MNLDGVPPKIRMKFGLVIHYVHQRVFPIKEGLYTKPKDIGFDELLNSSLDMGTPLAILHKSSDNKWYYVVGPLSCGWVEKERIALCRLEELKDFLNKSPFVVITKSKVAIFLNPSFSPFC
jgi:hypothetical protein